MGLFREPQQTTETLPQGNSDLLTALNLTQADIDALHKDREVESNKAQLAQEASAYYKEISSGQISFAEPKPVKFGTLVIKPQIQKDASEVCDSIYSQVNTAKANMAPQDQEHLNIYLQTFAQNFGQEALNARDWKTAVNSYHLATEGGIIHAPEIIKRIGELFPTDKNTRTEIYEYISQKIDPSTAEKPNNPDPKPTIIKETATEPTITPTSIPDIPQPIATQTPEAPPITATTAPAPDAAPASNLPPREKRPTNVLPYAHLASSREDTLAIPQATSPILNVSGNPTSIDSSLRPAPPNPNASAGLDATRLAA